MKNPKNKTKRALIFNGLILLLCCSMFISTTFAWFTDTVTSGTNHIIAGNLDVAMYNGVWGGSNFSWSEVTQTTGSLFDETALWEPGHTEVVYLKVTNEGDLALKYNMSVTEVASVDGTSILGNNIHLADYLKLAVMDVTTAFADRDAARAAAAAAGPVTLTNGFTTEYLSLYTTAQAAADSSLASDHIVAVVVYMPEEIGNEVNYLDGVVPEITLGIDVLATQLTQETDGFDSSYDAGAVYAAP